jgi:hypothetical protein
MADEPITIHEIPYLRLFPWLRLGRSIGVASDPKKLALAIAGSILLSAGWAALHWVLPGSTEVAPLSSQWHEPLQRASFEGSLADASWPVIEPMTVAIGPFFRVFSPTADRATFFYALATGLWAVVVWGIFGGAIARIAAVQVARAERVSVRTALVFAAKRWVALIGAPLTPFLGVVLFAVPCALYGILYRLPGSLASAIAGLFLVLPILAGVALTLIVIGLMLAWPLMVATVAAEAEDGFDALSRSYAYVHQRFGRYVVYSALALVLGSIGYVFVNLFGWLVLVFTHWALSFGAPAEVVTRYLHAVPVATSSVAVQFHWIWVSAVGLFVRAWVYSFFWSSAVTIYLLLRHDVDGTAWNEVA